MSAVKSGFVIFCSSSNAYLCRCSFLSKILLCLDDWPQLRPGAHVNVPFVSV